ncbi:hypothetical protein JKP88DRAFT_254321 [Tribonema minus]|uniref:Uncharacterized protein n=1 Tax=Tribonema minus TaxID=303371 RepID=A0A835Z3X3_9STRA|nr:hypothetical protein JKP88DRAFT_254321 [Tribonema minus]
MQPPMKPLTFCSTAYCAHASGECQLRQQTLACSTTTRIGFDASSSQLSVELLPLFWKLAVMLRANLLARVIPFHARAAVGRGLCRAIGSAGPAPAQAGASSFKAVLAGGAALTGVAGALAWKNGFCTADDITMRLEKGDQILHIIGTIHVGDCHGCRFALIDKQAKQLEECCCTHPLRPAPSEDHGDGVNDKVPSSTSTIIGPDEGILREQNIPQWAGEHVYMGDALYEMHRLHSTPTLQTLLITSGCLFLMSAFSYMMNPDMCQSEFDTAVEEARKANIPVVLGDRPLLETLVRAAQELKAVGIQHSVSVMNKKGDDISKEEIVQIYAWTPRKLDVWWDNMRDAKKAPGFFSAVIEERDAYMADSIAHCLEQRHSKSTVMVVGAAHQPGIVGHLQEKHRFTLVPGHVVLPRSAAGDESTPVEVDAFFSDAPLTHLLNVVDTISILVETPLCKDLHCATDMCKYGRSFQRPITEAALCLFCTACVCHCQWGSRMCSNTNWYTSFIILPIILQVQALARQAELRFKALPQTLMIVAALSVLGAVTLPAELGPAGSIDYILTSGCSRHLHADRFESPVWGGKEIPMFHYVTFCYFIAFPLWFSRRRWEFGVGCAGLSAIFALIPGAFGSRWCSIACAGAIYYLFHSGPRVLPIHSKAAYMSPAAAADGSAAVKTNKYVAAVEGLADAYMQFLYGSARMDTHPGPIE